MVRPFVRPKAKFGNLNSEPNRVRSIKLNRTGIRRWPCVIHKPGMANINTQAGTGAKARNGLWSYQILFRLRMPMMPLEMEQDMK